MEKNNAIDQTQTEATNGAVSKSVWLEEHARLIEKLESAYSKQTNIDEDSSKIRLFGISIGKFNFLIDTDTRCEVVEENKIFNIPLSDYWLIGVSNIRSEVVPIFDFEYVMTGTKYSFIPNQSKTVVIGEGDNAIGLVVNKLPTSIHFDKQDKVEDFSGLPEQIQSHVLYSYKKENEIWTCVDLPKIFESLTK